MKHFFQENQNSPEIFPSLKIEIKIHFYSFIKIYNILSPQKGFFFLQFFLMKNAEDSKMA